MRICQLDYCDKKHKGRGYCQGHLRQLTKGQELRPLRLISANGYRYTGDGYIELFLPEYEGSRSNGYILEHRYVMEQSLGRRLMKHENVHHINGVRDDNRLQNLELWMRPQPTGQRVADLLDWLAATYPDELRNRLSGNSESTRR